LRSEVRDFGFEEVAFAIMKNLESADRLGVEVRSVEFEINRSGREVHSAWSGHESREGNYPPRVLRSLSSGDLSIVIGSLRIGRVSRPMRAVRIVVRYREAQP